MGIATESLRKVETSFELVAIDAREWTSARQEEAVRLQKQYSLLLEPEITKKTERLYPEWPKATD